MQIGLRLTDTTPELFSCAWRKTVFRPGTPSYGEKSAYRTTPLKDPFTNAGVGGLFGCLVSDHPDTILYPEQQNSTNDT